MFVCNLPIRPICSSRPPSGPVSVRLLTDCILNENDAEEKEKRVEKVTDHLKEGEEIKVKVLEIDRQGKIRLTMKGIEE